MRYHSITFKKKPSVNNYDNDDAVKSSRNWLRSGECNNVSVPNHFHRDSLLAGRHWSLDVWQWEESGLRKRKLQFSDRMSIIGCRKCTCWWMLGEYLSRRLNRPMRLQYISLGNTCKSLRASGKRETRRRVFDCNRPSRVCHFFKFAKSRFREIAGRRYKLDIDARSSDIHYPRAQLHRTRHSTAPTLLFTSASKSFWSNAPWMQYNQHLFYPSIVTILGLTQRHQSTTISKQLHLMATSIRMRFWPLTEAALKTIIGLLKSLAFK